MGRRSARLEEGAFVVEGPVLVAAATAAGWEIEAVFVANGAWSYQPPDGVPVFELGPDGAPGNPVGSITSSTLSPMLGASSVAFAMVRTAHAEPGTVLGVPAEGVRATATVQPRLRFLAEGA